MKLIQEGIIFDWIGTLSAGSKGGVYPYSEKVLQYLREKKEIKYRIGLVSIAGFGVKERIKDLEKTGIIYYFDSIIINDKMKTPKHYIQCMHEMGTVPRTTIVVGDTASLEIRIGNKLGCKTYWIQNSVFAPEPPNKKTGEPTKIINSVEDLLKIL